MTFRDVLIIGGVIAAVLMATRCSRDPLRTDLPFGTTDLSSVEPQLARLPAEERELVEAYVKRSNGDVLTPELADPDMPLTARTFAQAIELERAWKLKVQEQDAVMGKLKVARDAKLAPLRATVRASIVKAEVLTREEWHVRQNPNLGHNPSKGDTSLVFLVRIRLQNLRDESIKRVTGSVQARDRDAYLPLNICWIDQGNIAPNASVEVYCGRANQDASDQEKDFVKNPPGRFQVEWEPKRIELENGRTMDAGS